jgi:hypothetical protein
MTYPPYAFAALTSRVFNGPSSDRSVSKWLQQCQNHVGHIFEDTKIKRPSEQHMIVIWLRFCGGRQNRPICSPMAPGVHL